MLNMQALRRYEDWIGKSPWDVWMAVKAVGGWVNVFPSTVPIWASRIRQYFNVNPMSLKLLTQVESKLHLRWEVERVIKVEVKFVMGIPVVANGGDVAAGLGALSEFVYEDPMGRSIWLQTSPGAGVYHFPRPPSEADSTKAAIMAGAAGQAQSPVFKLVCPDGTGGSRECVITNNGRNTIGAVGEEVKISDRFVKDSVRQGSYNFAETIEKGMAAHTRMDVKTDPMRAGYFVEPPDLFQLSDLHTRRFPATDSQGMSLAEQTGAAR